MAAHPLKDRHVRDELLADGSMVLFHPTSRRVVTLNPPAALVWEYCDGQHSEEAIASELRSVFTETTGVLPDVSAVIRNLREQGLLTD